jgi:putative hydrolase of the HAD superfamily
MTIQAVLFDADGVLIHPWRFARYLELQHGITPTMTRGFFDGIFGDCLVGRADLKRVLPPFLQEWGWEDSPEQFVQTWLEVEDAVDERVAEVVRTLRRAGYVCCLATSQERYRAEYMQVEMGLGELFDRLFFSYAMGCQKPEPDFYLRVEMDLGVGGESILFWDDSERNVEAARERGWWAELYLDFERFLEKLEEYPPGATLLSAGAGDQKGGT